MRHLIALLIAVVPMACGGQPAPPGASPSPASAAASLPAPTAGGNASNAAEVRTYDIRGRVTSLDHMRMTVTLDHEAIPGLMDAMKMEYKVAPHTLLDGLTPGTTVQGRLGARGGDYTIMALTKR